MPNLILWRAPGDGRDAELLRKLGPLQLSWLGLGWELRVFRISAATGFLRFSASARPLRAPSGHPKVSPDHSFFYAKYQPERAYVDPFRGRFSVSVLENFGHP